MGCFLFKNVLCIDDFGVIIEGNAEVLTVGNLRKMETL